MGLNNIAFLPFDLVKRATITASETAANPAANMADDARWKVWRKDSSAQAVIDISLDDYDLDNLAFTDWRARDKTWQRTLWSDGRTSAFVDAGIRPGDRVTLTGEGYVTTSGETGKIVIWTEDGNGVELWRYEITITSTVYAVFSQTITIPKYLDQATIKLAVQLVNGTGNVYVRKISIKPDGWSAAEIGLAILDHTMFPHSSIRIRGSHDSSFTFWVYDQTIEPWQALTSTDTTRLFQRQTQWAGPTDAIPNTTLFIPLGNVEIAKYWRIEINFNNAATDLLQISRLLLGRVWRPKTNMSWGADIVRRRIQDVVESSSGQQWINDYGSRATITATLDWLDAEDVSILEGIENAVSPSPLLAILYPQGAGTSPLSSAVYGALKVVSKRHKNALYSSAKIIITEHV